MIENVTPGEILMEEFIKPFGLNMNKLSQLLNVPANRISEIVKGHRAITADTALRLAKCFGNSELFWMNLQRDYDISEAKKSHPEKDVAKIS